MHRLIAAGLFLALALSAQAQQPAPETIPVPFTAYERSVVEEMCGDAFWAARRRFEGFCEHLHEKFTAAVKAVADKAAADKAKAADPASPKESQ